MSLVETDRSLQAIADQDVDKLLELLETRKPYSTPAVMWIRTQRRWAFKVSGMRLELFSPGGDWNTGQVVGKNPGLMPHGYVNVLVYSDPSSAPALVQSIRSSPGVVPWVRVFYMVHVLQEPLMSLVRELAAENMGEEDLFVEIVHNFVVSTEVAAIITVAELPDGVTLAPLREEHIPWIQAALHYCTSSYLPVMRTILRHNLTSGVFLRGVLVAMAMEDGSGAMGMVHCEPALRGRGLARLAVTSLVRGLAEKGQDVHFCVLHGNTASLKLMAKCGLRDPCQDAAYFYNSRNK